MITATKFAVNSGTPEVGGALLPVPGVGWGPGEELDDDTAAMLHKSVWQQLTEQLGADIFICTQGFPMLDGEHKSELVQFFRVTEFTTNVAQLSSMGGLHVRLSLLAGPHGDSSGPHT